MRHFQIVVFMPGIVAFLASPCFTGRTMGDTLWKVGMATMISNIVLLLLWPAAKRN